jgi:hypothetical protein
MTRGIVSLALMLLVGANAKHSCELDSSAMVTHGINAALDIWAASKRCHGAMVNLAPVKCERDVAGSISELATFGGAIAEMVGSCGAVKLANHDCAMAADSLVAATAGLAAVGGAIADQCGLANVPAALDGDILGTATELGKCTAEAGSSMNSIFQASNTLQHVQKSCSDSREICKVDALDVVSVLSSFGGYIAAAYADCSLAANPHTKSDIGADACSADILMGIAQLSNLAKLGLTMQKACASSSSRLYLDTNTEATTTTGNLSSFALAAFLPIAMVLSFVAGRRFGKADQSTSARSRSMEGSELLESGEE